MNKFRNLTTTKKSAPKEVKTSLGIIDFVPTFEKDDIVRIVPKYKNYTKEYAKINHLSFAVDYCKVSDLGDMIIEVLYLQKLGTTLISNPYLVEHFELAK